MQAIIFLLTKSMAIGILASIPLGPVGVLCIQRTLNRGLLSGFLSGMGAALADTLFSIVAILGLSFIINFVEAQQVFMRVAGGSILLIIGVRIFYSNPVRQIRQNHNGRQSYFSDFFSVLVLMMTNPLAIFLFLAAFASLELVAPDPGPMVAGAIVTGILAGASLYWFILSSIISRFRNKFRLRILLRINKTAGAIIILSGFAALISVLF